MILLLLIALVILIIFFGVIFSIVYLIMKKATPGVFLSTALIGMVLLVLGLRFSFPWWPIGMRHLCYVAKGADMYSPIIVEPFAFNIKGSTGKYPLKLDYYTAYTIGIRSSGGNFPEDFEYKGKIKAEFYKDGELVYTMLSEKPRYHKSYVSDGKKHLTLKFKKIGLITFDVPIAKWYSEGVEVVVTVVKEDDRLTEYADQLNLYVGIDWLL